MTIPARLKSHLEQNHIRYSGTRGRGDGNSRPGRDQEYRFDRGGDAWPHGARPCSGRIGGRDDFPRSVLPGVDGRPATDGRSEVESEDQRSVVCDGPDAVFRDRVAVCHFPGSGKQGPTDYFERLGQVGRCCGVGASSKFNAAESGSTCCAGGRAMARAVLHCRTRRSGREDLGRGRRLQGRSDCAGCAPACGGRGNAPLAAHCAPGDCRRHVPCSHGSRLKLI